MLKNLHGQGLGSGFDFWSKRFLSLMGPPVKHYHSNITKVRDWAFQLSITYGGSKSRTNQWFGGGEPLGTPAMTEIHLQCFKTERLHHHHHLLFFFFFNMKEDLNMWSLTEFTESLNCIRCWKYYHYSSLWRDHTSPSQRPRDSGETRCYPESPQFSLRDKMMFLWTLNFCVSYEV